ncbi:hypothetical protein ACEW7V_03140 [Areca yellow leaf disease phytoplasma]|uniref:hypothetical protein n=1 Tax=Areca yellow leaf disease phytoplasma TaxID=927614 RepID=UPI0035B54C0A
MLKNIQLRKKENLIVELIGIAINLSYANKINKEAMNCGGKVDIKVDLTDFVYIVECKTFDVLNKDEKYLPSLIN